MKLKFLGTGTSFGVPEIGCGCTVCKSKDKKNSRFRASALLDVDGIRILIDCGPDFRTQIMSEFFSRINGLLLTHEHYDHVGGIDDLRPFCTFADIDVFSNEVTLSALKERIPYVFAPFKYPGVPSLRLNEVNGEDPFFIGNIKVQPVNLMHHKLSILGYRIGDFAYLTDANHIPETEYDKLQNLDVLVINALRIEKHLSHFSLAESLAEIEKIAPKRAYLIHMSHRIGLHEEVQKILPENVYLSYDGLTLDIEYNDI